MQQPDSTGTFTFQSFAFQEHLADFLFLKMFYLCYLLFQLCQRDMVNGNFIENSDKLETLGEDEHNRKY